MTKIRTGLVVAAAAAGLVSAIAAPAQAATGQLVLRDAAQRAFVINDPRAGCSRVDTGFVRVANKTDAPITVYEDAWCRGWSVVVLPGSDEYVGARHSFSAPW
ncbi:hypothetical protein [Nonomuraea sp. NPDC050643]|uniref:hypothetical protein n=1 Tax=Nonomuraea sp. NPDC050643 TaxID=3155660 RepID=UPI0033DE0826